MSLLLPLLTPPMIKLASSRPAQAVGIPDNSTGADGDGGRTAGTPPVGGEATGASGSQYSETLLPQASTGVSGAPTTSPRSRFRSPRSSATPRVASAGRRLGSQSGEVTPEAAPPSPPPVNLKPRTFRIGTWNMQGSLDSARRPKIDRAAGFMAVEKIDLLVVTETHHPPDSPPAPRGVRVLSHSGISQQRAGIAILSSSRSSWSCLFSVALSPGYSILTLLSHPNSRESFWLLSVYGDSSGTSSRSSFWTNIRNSLADFVSAYPNNVLAFPDWPVSWPGCLAVGDWNMVLHDEDRLPVRATPASILRPVLGVLSLCRAVDAAGPDAFPRGFTWSCASPPRIVHSRLDRIYVPSQSWSSGLPVAIPTNWSDHKLVWADCSVLSPRVEIAVAAPRLPDIDSLSKDGQFWSSVLRGYNVLVSSPVTLETWSAFKDLVLEEGSLSKSRRWSIRSRDWRAALRGDLIHEDDLHHAVYEALRSASLSRSPAPVTSCRWRSVLPDHMLPKPVARHLPRRATRWADVQDSFPHSWTYEVPLYASVFDADSRPSDPIGPWFPAIVPVPQYHLADLLDTRVSLRRAATLRKYNAMVDSHSSAWFKLSSNKESDERGSRASVSVDGLRRSPRDVATTSLSAMLPIAHSYFRDLHTPIAHCPSRAALQAALLDEVRLAYGPLPPPSAPVSGPFSVQEVKALRPKMHNTAPGPDGIQNAFWKSLASRIESLAGPAAPPLSFWEAFRELTDDIRSRGTDRCRFKDANLSLFFKKGDPTLVANYRPISSMNTDCKLYTNLVNSRLAPWAVSKLHPDQKGFVPGRLITEHTRLAVEVAHLSNSTSTDGYIVSLDQAKAYDRTDLSWLIRVLRAMGLPPDLVSMVSDVVHGCKTRVRINSAYSAPYTLARGVRQGDPLSCLLYDFSIEPLGMRMRRAIGGISVHGLPPARLIMYADDMNLFLSSQDDLPLIKSTLSATSLAIGSRFNFEKTDVLLVGSVAHRERPSASFTDVLACFQGAFILPPGSPLRVLGVWVSSLDFAAARWAQISSHISHLIAQWNAIGASLRNRVLLAKALLLSRCYYLLDGNGIPPRVLRQISQKILRFVRGRFSSAPYSILSAPLSEGGLDCPSLSQRRLAYDAKFVGDMISAPLDSLWKLWARADLSFASHNGTPAKHKRVPLQPLLQHAHVTLKHLEPRLRQAYVSLRTLGYNIECSFPSASTRRAMLISYHPALPMPTPRRAKLLSHFGIETVQQLSTPLNKAALRRRSTADMSLPSFERARNALLKNLRLSSWLPDWHLPDRQLLLGNVRIWPSMKGPYGCVRILSSSPSLWTPRSGLRRYYPSKVRGGRPGFQPLVTRVFPLLPSAPLAGPSAHRQRPVVRVWTDGSALHNGRDDCTAGAAWFSSHGAFEYARVTGVIPSNNIAEVVAVVMALRAWHGSNLHIITDSSYMLRLVDGGLLAAERDGWPDLPFLGYEAPASLRPLFQLLLCLLRSHNSSLEFSWVKGHSGDDGNTQADFYASLGASTDDWEFDISSLSVPSGWVDTAPVLNHQPLAHLTYLIVRDSTPSPILTDRFRPFCQDWSYWIARKFDVRLDITRHFHRLWEVSVPAGLRDLMWKIASGSLPLGRSWHGTSDLGRVCRCGSPVSASHIWSGCPSYALSPLLDLLCESLRSLHPGSHRSLHPEEWDMPLWYPLFVLQPLESYLSVSPESRELLSSSRERREQAIGSYLWFIWKARMKEIMEPDFSFIPSSCVPAMRSTLGLPAPRAESHSPLQPPPMASSPGSSPVRIQPSRRGTIRAALEARSPVVFSPPRVITLRDTLPPPLYAASRGGSVLPPPADSRPTGSPTPSPLGFTENTLRLVYERQLGTPVIDIIAAIVADDDTPSPPPLPPEPPPEPPPPPPVSHSSWCTCTPCLEALDGLYG